MFDLYRSLRDRADPVRVGVIGAGLFGTHLIHQLERVHGLQTVAIADIEPDRAERAFTGAGVSTSEITVVSTPMQANTVINSGGRAVLTDGEDLVETDVVVVVEATGLPNVGARHAHGAITAGKHVVMATVETETVVGPILAKLADDHGVTYSMAYGDQPSLIVELHDWARLAGFDVIAAGKGNSYREAYRYGTPTDIFERIGIDPGFADTHDLNPRMYNSFYDGTKVAVEMCAVANALEMPPDVPGMHLEPAEIPEIPELLRPEADGGILKNAPAVDTVSSIYPDGTSVDRDISFGVFIVTKASTKRVRDYLDTFGGTGLYTASAGMYQLFYRPYHLPGIETGISVASAALRNQATGAPQAHVGEVVAAAKRDLEPGEELDGGGGTTIYGKLVTAREAAEAGYVPFELLDEAVVTTAIAQDEIVTEADVRVNEDAFIYRLRQRQEREL